MLIKKGDIISEIIFYFYFICITVFTCRYVYVPQMCLVFTEARRGHQIFQNLSYKWLWATMWALGTPHHLEGKLVLFACLPAELSHLFSPYGMLYKMHLCCNIVIFCCSVYFDSQNLLFDSSKSVLNSDLQGFIINTRGAFESINLVPCSLEHFCWNGLFLVKEAAGMHAQRDDK